MARTSNITFAQVATIADGMKAAGLRPTARAVRERIGSGSMGTIHKLLQQWQGKGGSADEEGDAPELPSPIAEALMDFVSTQVAEACEPLAEQIKDAQDAAQELAEENERLTKLTEDLEKDSYNAAMKYAAAAAQADEASNTAAATRKELSQAQATIAAMEAERADLRNKIKDLENAKAEAAKAIDRSEYLQELYNAADKERSVLLAKLDAAQQRADESAARLEASERTTANLRDELKAANATVTAYSARFEGLARELDELKAKSAKAAAPKTTKAPAKKMTQPKLEAHK